MEFIFCIQQYTAWCRTGDGRIFSFFGKWIEWVCEGEALEGQIAIIPAGERRVVVCRIVAGRKMRDQHRTRFSADGQAALSLHSNLSEKMIDARRKKQHGVHLQVKQKEE